MTLKKTNPTQTSSWKSLEAHFNEIKNIEMEEMFKNGKKATDFTVNWHDFTIDFSKNRINKKTLDLLFDLASECDLKNAIEQQFKGEKINETENRAVLHTALRSDGNEKIMTDNKDVVPSILKSRNKIRDFTDDVLSGKIKGSTNKPFTDVVNIGIGGSDLGPAMVVEALKFYSSKVKSHFVSNVDGDHVLEVIKELNPRLGIPSLKAYCLIFVYIFPMIYTPTIIYKIGIENPAWITYFIVILSEFILISLYNIQDQMEYPFDDEGLDDIDLDIFKMVRK